MEIDWQSQNIVQSSWGVSKIDSSWIIAGINQGHWQVDTFYAETFDTVVVMIPDTQQLLRLHTLERGAVRAPTLFRSVLDGAVPMADGII